MTLLSKYPTLNEEVLSAMRQCDLSELAGYMGEFFQEKKESFTYRQDNSEYYINSFFPSFPGPAWNRLIKGVNDIVYHERRVPLQADIVVTGRCHCNCWHCFRAKYGEEELSIEKIKECMNELSELGTASVGITGGEPMLRTDIFEIIESIPEGMEGVLFSTGLGIDDACALKFKNTRLTRCILSLDHFEEEICCKLRRNRNVFKDAVQAIKALTTQNIYTAVTVCVTQELLKEGALQQYFEFVAGLGVQEVRVVMPIPQGNLEGSEVGRFYGKAMGLIKQLKRENASNETFPVIVNFCEFESSDYFGCGAGSNYIAINNDGNVTPCVAVPSSFGSVHEDTLGNIYKKMGEVFSSSNCACFGISSSRVMTRDQMDTSITPTPPDVSFDIAKKCRISSERAAIFRYCASKGQPKEGVPVEAQTELPTPIQAI
ncbi:radical SAM/SPASM domain-containing protein [Paenibacillus sp. GCM10012306]|uniref:radical SAM/SPASM domain-containing protein n=1 Tax=Paenibacillus sp. GCM10012306 TaxID=3317342 RepID=UPI003608ED88